MADQITIGVVDKETADAIQRELAAQGIAVERRSRGRDVAFGARIGSGPAYADLTVEEVLEIVEGLGPTLVDAVFDTLERFRDRVRLLINGEPKELPMRVPGSMEEWLRNLRHP